MSLPARQQRALECIDEGLSRSEPKLAAKFAMFARLCGTDVPPGREQLTPRPALLGRLRAQSAGGTRSSGGSLVLRAVIVGHLALVLVLLAVFVALNVHSSGRCGAGAAGRAAAAAARAGGCSLQVGSQGSLLPK